jgi:3-phytase
MRHRILFVLLLVSLALGCEKSIRFATFSVPLTRDKAGELAKDFVGKDNPQFKDLAEVIQRTQPDVLLITNIDFDSAGRSAYLFQKNYLEVPQNGATPIHYAHHYLPPVNAGVASGFDQDHDGKAVTTPGTAQYANDAIGYGKFPGQGGMVLMSKFPIHTQGIRTFERLKWKDMPGAMLPTDSAGKPWYSEEELSVLRLSSRNHCDVPIQVGDKTVHVLISSPTSPENDGPEDRNGKRNHDEVRFWVDYLGDEKSAKYIVDDTNQRGGIAQHGASDSSSHDAAKLPLFVILGQRAEGVDPLISDPAIQGSASSGRPEVLVCKDAKVMGGEVRISPTTQASTQPSTKPTSAPTTQPLKPWRLVYLDVRF